jgi:hypothetical protein
LVRLVQVLCGPGGWAAVPDVQKLLSGPVVEITQSPQLCEELDRAIARY